MSSGQMQEHASDERLLGLKELVAMGVGGMVGGGIFSVLGLAVAQAGHAAPLAFLVGGLIALLTGYSYARLGRAFHSDGGSFTYLEHAFEHPNVAGIGGWLLLAGYIGTLALYAYTFGMYGAAMLGGSQHVAASQHLLQALVLLLFLGVNLYGVKAAGESEDVIVLIKLLILLLFALTGLFYLTRDRLGPVFNQGHLPVVMGAALIFVASEGFELIPNAVNEMQDPRRDLLPSIVLAVAITTAVYFLVSLVAVGNLSPREVRRYQEYALAAAARPFLGQAGFLLIGLGALLSTTSAINATMFGTARLAMVMAQEHALPKVFSLKERSRNIPWVSLLIITGVALVFAHVGDLTVVASLSSSTFLLIFAAVNLSAVRLRARIGIGLAVPIAALCLTLASWLVLIAHLWQSDRRALTWIGGAYGLVIVAELAFSERRLLFRRKLK
jgi:amino acid transporter